MINDTERKAFEEAVKRASGLEYLSPYDAMWKALEDCLIMIGRIKKHCQITDNAGYTPDGRMLTLTNVEENARQALAANE